ncbi:hypothetical protein BDZ45DRAFT_737121 [Acephala macrosclerotiorum]|nr:hypothetical protein BDZ45DRAFT_737121 [Acephala macrosclerotiorum]
MEPNTPRRSFPAKPSPTRTPEHEDREARGSPPLEVERTADSVQVPAQLLTQLLSSIDHLRTTVERLEKTNASLQTSFAQLEKKIVLTQKPARTQINNRQFHCFRKLPTELRYMIWKFAFRAPQTHTVVHDGISKSKLNDVMQACKEASKVGKGMQLDYHRYFSDGGSPPQYMNIELDTIWLQDLASLPDDMEFYCGRCGGKELVFGCDDLNMVCPHRLRLKRIVIHEEDWQTPHCPPPPDLIQDKCAMVLRQVSPRELYIVVLDTSAADRGLYKFDEPEQDPWKALPMFFLHTAGNPSKPEYRKKSMNHSWSAVSKWTKSSFEKLKDTHMKDIMDDMLLDGFTVEEIKNDKGWHGYQAWSLWKPPAVVKHVQVFAVEE